MGHPLVEALQWHIDNGAEMPISDTPVNRVASPHLAMPEPLKNPANAPVSAPAPRAAAPNPALSASFAAQRQAAVEAAKACNTLEELRAAIAAYDGLDVKRTATHLVFADGRPDARVMVIGEAPGADEDRQGLPFVGVSGQLLDKMFECIGLNRKSEDATHALYISNILNWRPPGNRTPTEAEIALALPFIERHITLARPQFLVLAGAVAAKSLLNMDLSISKLRGKLYDYKFITPGISDGLEPFKNAPKILPTYHPSFLLRTPVQKRKAWQDLLLLQSAL
jgi:DNA polymerase